ncbi:MAG: Vitamin epoxide reductase [Candidatus Nomurabacteria bacterium]|nr:Vitamin epoxide reductase [Candidatus Nomurabacteria bacterium]
MTTFIGMIAAVIGFGISWYIRTKQQSNTPLMCPRRSPCETVINSPQAKTLGFSNTSLGMLYYAIVFFLFTYYGTGYGVQLILLVVTTIGFLFSLYLVGVQHFKIKQWCVWCLGSAVASTILFVSALTIFF